MRKNTTKKERTAVVKKPKYKDASTQTHRYVEYMPLPIVVDIKSENESDDAASYAEPFNDDAEPYNGEQENGRIVETLKIEINEVHGHFRPTDENDHPPMIEEYLFDDKLCESETVPTAKRSKKSAPVEQKKSKKRIKSENDRLPKAKRAKKVDGKPGERKRRKPSDKPDFVECTLCNFTCKRPSHLKRHFLMHTGEKPHQCKFINTFLSPIHFRSIHLIFLCLQVNIVQNLLPKKPISIDI